MNLYVIGKLDYKPGKDLLAADVLPQPRQHSAEPQAGRGGQGLQGPPACPSRTPERGAQPHIQVALGHPQGAPQALGQGCGTAGLRRAAGAGGIACVPSVPAASGLRWKEPG